MRYKVVRGWCLGNGKDIRTGDTIYSPGNIANAPIDARQPLITEATAKLKLKHGLIRHWPDEPAAAVSRPDPEAVEAQSGGDPVQEAKPKRGRGGKPKETRS
jgi:hypothetical protein